MLKCFLDTSDKTMCTGCRACEQACPKGAIAMTEDAEGFFYPVINEEICVHCDICRKTCPVSQPPEKNKYIAFYAAQAKSKKDLEKSSSGGCFITLAKKMIEDGGAVFGCIIDDDFNVVKVRANTYEELVPMQGSKYVQCDVKDTYKEAKELLDSGRKVLYTGTPCQIAGLKNYLKKDYESLVTMDFLCHGVPSNKLFRENVKYLERKFGGKLSDYRFRDKSKKGWYMMTSFRIGKKTVYEQGRINAYAGAFSGGLIDRECCYSCKFVGPTRVSDITVADFWGFKDKSGTFKRALTDGISILMVNTEKGKGLLEKISDKMQLEKRPIEDAIPGNGALGSDERCVPIPSMRKTIYENISDFGKLAEGPLKPRDYKNLVLKQKVPKWLVGFIRKIRR